MKPAVLYSGTVGAEPEEAVTMSFDNPPGRVMTVFASGLGAAETVAINLWTGTAWLPLKVAGAAVVLDADTPSRLIEGPGVYQLSVAASAGAIVVGVYA